MKHKYSSQYSQIELDDSTTWQASDLTITRVDYNASIFIKFQLTKGK